MQASLSGWGAKQRHLQGTEMGSYSTKSDEEILGFYSWVMTNQVRIITEKVLCLWSKKDFNMLPSPGPSAALYLFPFIPLSFTYSLYSNISALNLRLGFQDLCSLHSLVYQSPAKLYLFQESLSCLSGGETQEAGIQTYPKHS